MKLINSMSPQIRTPKTTAWIMQQVLIATMPVMIAATYFFGVMALVNVFIALISAVVFEAAYQKLTHQPITINDYSAMVTGVLMGLSLPVTAPWWSLIVGSFIAIVIVKHFIGKGLGRNRLNPALTSRVLLKVFLTPWITNWVLPGADLISSPTPLTYIGHGATSLPSQVTLPSLYDLFMGFNLGGNIGETSKLAILIGCAYLVVRGVINIKIPLLYILSTVVVMGLVSTIDLNFMLTHALTGTLVFAAVFMATDYSSGALTPTGQTLFAIGCGVLTALFRYFFNFPGGVGFAVITMNLLAPTLDKYFAPRIYGYTKRLKVDFNRQK